MDEIGGQIPSLQKVHLIAKFLQKMPKTGTEMFKRSRFYMAMYQPLGNSIQNATCSVEDLGNI